MAANLKEVKAEVTQETRTDLRGKKVLYVRTHFDATIGGGKPTKALHINQHKVIEFHPTGCYFMDMAGRESFVYGANIELVEFGEPKPAK